MNISPELSWRVRALLAAAVLAFAVALSPAARAASVTYTVIPDQCRINTIVAQPMTRLRGNAIGTFRVISGEISGDPADPAHTGKVRIVVDAGSYSSGSAIRDHTVVDSVLDAADFPEITFSSLAIDNVAMANSDEGSASIDGNLTLRGQTRPLTALVSVALPSPDRLEARGEMSFHYPDFGVPVPLGIFHLMRAGDDVIVKFLIVARRAPR